MATTLVLVRHGKSKQDPDDDTLRPLTAAGRDRFAATVSFLWRLGVRFDQLLHASADPCAESAELLAPLLGGSPTETHLLDGAPEPDLLDLIQGSDVGVVGLQPHLSELAAWLAIGRRTRADAFRIGRGGVMLLRGKVKPGGMQLRALWPPSAIRSFAG